MKLGDVKANKFVSEQSDVVRLISNTGGTKVRLYWLGEEVIEMISEITPESPIGWYDADFWDDKGEDGGWDMESPLASSNDCPIAVGEALMVEFFDENAGLVFAGEVDKKDIPLTVGKYGAMNKKVLRANCTPVDITLGKILANEYISEQSDVMRLISPTGGTKVRLYWLGEEVIEMISEITPESPIGWYDADFWDDKGEEGGWDMESPLASSNDCPIRAGKGLMLEFFDEKAGIIIPSAISDSIE